MSHAVTAATSQHSYVGWQRIRSPAPARPACGHASGSVSSREPCVDIRSLSPRFPCARKAQTPGRLDIASSSLGIPAASPMRFFSVPTSVKAPPSNPTMGSPAKVVAAGFAAPPGPLCSSTVTGTVSPRYINDYNKPTLSVASHTPRILGTSKPQSNLATPQLQSRPICQSSKATSKGFQTPMLKALGRDLTQAAENGELDPLIGRETQIEQMMQALARRRKNNPVLVGDPGVGKTAVVEGLAQKIATGDVPDVLREKRIVQLDVASLLAGTQNRGEFEQRMKTVVNEALASNKQIILFIDEIHTIVGAGRSGGGGSTVDAASILKPVLARGDIQCIGVTTVEEYRAHIEKDSSLERRFQLIPVEQTDIGETVQILKGLAPKYQIHHEIEYSAEALLACVRLAAEYIPDRSMPDKAIDVFDEVGAFVRLRSQSSKAKVPESERAKATRQKLLEVQKLKESSAQAEQFNLAASLKLVEVKLQVLFEELLSKEQADLALPDVEPIMVMEEDVAHVISRMTGVPVEKMSEDESVRMQNLEELLHKRIIGQDQAVVSVSKALRRARVGLKDPSRPIASFLFCGPTGVGKTELCKALSEAYFGKEDAMIRLDMSEFMERHSVSKLIGSPAGYVGYGDENQLTDRIRRKPYTLILFDEIEKAHSDVLNLMLQIMDDGCLTDATGRRVSFKNALIIMTSNVVAGTSELKQAFSPEFLNRLDEVIPFSPLSKSEVADIAELELSKTVERVRGRGVSLSLSAAFKDEILDQGFDATYGARSLRRSVATLLDDELANSLLEQPFVAGEQVYVDVDDDRQVVVVREELAEDPEQVPSENWQVDSQDAKRDPVQECAVDLISVPESDSVKAETESTKGSSCSDNMSLKGPKLEVVSTDVPLFEVSLSD